ncbi:MAG TPA: hypothetical protein VGS59_12855 [Candidatus Acidoferrales bacterium]|nr:hypothetical protein [Candidatus Acidoferrales bacterium]
MTAPGTKKTEAGAHPQPHPSKKPDAAEAPAPPKRSAEAAPELPHAPTGEPPHPHGHKHYISLKLRDVSQLFNSMDPSPFIEKDLDDDAEEFIMSWAQEYPPDEPVCLRIYLEQWPSEDPKEMVKTAVHNHFAHRAQLAQLELKRLLEQGRTSLLIGSVFLSACLVSSQTLLGHDQGTWAAIVRESLTIAGWVAMWRPMQIYLYDWWPVRRRVRVFRKLSRMPVEVLQRPAA